MHLPPRKYYAFLIAIAFNSGYNLNDTIIWRNVIMTDNPLISVIVPVYKVEQYLDRCVSSLVNQIYTNIEIILVDDGSPDNSPAICDGWSEKDSRIKVIHKPNGGLSDARNCAVKVSSGEFICFVDSDDYVSADYVEYLLRIMREHDCDISCAAFRTVYDGAETFENQPEDEVLCLDNVAASKAFLTTHYMQMVTAWGKLFPAELVRAYPFPVGLKHEDEAVTYKMYYSSAKTALGRREIYAYYQNSGSITHNRDDKSQMDALKAIEEQAEFYEAAGCPELTAIAAERVLIHLITLAALGEEVYRRYLKEKRAAKYLKKVRPKYRALYYCYMLFGIDINAMLLKLKNR